jgi:hypothetical protein
MNFSFKNLHLGSDREDDFDIFLRFFQLKIPEIIVLGRDRKADPFDNLVLDHLQNLSYKGVAAWTSLAASA